MSKSTNAIFSTIIATLIVAGLTVVGKWFNKTSDATFTSVFQGAVRYNSYVFIAMSASLFGAEGVALSGIFIAYMIILTNIIGGFNTEVQRPLINQAALSNSSNTT